MYYNCLCSHFKFGLTGFRASVWVLLSILASLEWVAFVCPCPYPYSSLLFHPYPIPTLSPFLPPLYPFLSPFPSLPYPHSSLPFHPYPIPIPPSPSIPTLSPFLSPFPSLYNPYPSPFLSPLPFLPPPFHPYPIPIPLSPSIPTPFLSPHPIPTLSPFLSLFPFLPYPYPHSSFHPPSPCIIVNLFPLHSCTCTSVYWCVTLCVFYLWKVFACTVHVCCLYFDIWPNK